MGAIIEFFKSLDGYEWIIIGAILLAIVLLIVLIVRSVCKSKKKKAAKAAQTEQTAIDVASEESTAEQEEPAASEESTAEQEQPAASEESTAEQEEPAASEESTAEQEQPAASEQPVAEQEQPISNEQPTDGQEQPASVVDEEDEALEEELEAEATVEETAEITPEPVKPVGIGHEYVIDEKPVTKVYHITKRKADGKWQVKASKGAKAVKLFSTQLAAIEFAKKLAANQDARIVIHKEDGSFRKLTYYSKK